MFIVPIPFGALSAWALSIVTNDSFDNLLIDGVVHGVIFGLFMGIFMDKAMRTARYDVLYAPESERIDIHALAELVGYRPSRVAMSAEIAVFNPSFWAGFLSGRITFYNTTDRTAIVGPRWHIKRIFEKLIPDYYVIIVSD